MTRKTIKRCLLEENNTLCHYKGIHKLGRSINLCCNFCEIKNCEQRCLNNLEKCGLLDVKFN